MCQLRSGNHGVVTHISTPKLAFLTQAYTLVACTPSFAIDIYIQITYKRMYMYMSMST